MSCEKRITLSLLLILDAMLEGLQKTLRPCKLPALLVALWFGDSQHKRLEFLHEPTLKCQIDAEVVPEASVSIPQVLVKAAAEV